MLEFTLLVQPINDKAYKRPPLHHQHHNTPLVQRRQPSPQVAEGYCGRKY